jgi:sodium-dependent dicarboxylate transporter 2/3/5
MPPLAANSNNSRLPTIGKIVGFLLFLIVWFYPAPGDLPPAAQRLAAVTALMAVLWLTQAIPIAATSLLPLALFPLLGIQNAADVSKSYISKSIFLFLGGFIIALGIEKWGLHRRMALHVVRLLGTSLKRIVLGFMLATAFLSMWISNTASTLLMLPIALAMISSLRDLSQPADTTNSTAADPANDVMSRMTLALLLGIAYAASIGGLTTLVGTPTNVAFVGIWENEFPLAPEMSAGRWMVAVAPLGLVLLLCTWAVLVWRLPRLPGKQRLDRSFFSDKLRELGRPTFAERLMLVVFASTALLWIFRQPLQFGAFTFPFSWGVPLQSCLVRLGVDAELAVKYVDDSTVAMTMALLMFFLPAARDENGRQQYLMDWETAERLPWGILLLIGGGFALAGAFTGTGLSEWIGHRFAEGVQDWPLWLLIAAVCLLLTCLTELTSNVATVSTLIPILASVCPKLGIDPRLILIPATISASCAFMLPIATPPNAIVFGSGRVRMVDMAKYGIVLNLLGVVLVTAATYYFIIPQFGISLEGLPDWAEPVAPR